MKEKRGKAAKNKAEVTQPDVTEEQRTEEPQAIPETKEPVVETPETAQEKEETAKSALAEAFEKKQAPLSEAALEKLRSVRAEQVGANKAVFAAARAEGRTWTCIGAYEADPTTKSCPFTKVPLRHVFVITDGVDTFEVGKGVAHNDGYAEIPMRDLNAVRVEQGLLGLKK